MTRRVLVVDDSATLRKIAQTVLYGAGYEVDTASDGAEGFERVQRAPFDLMLVDFVMPRLNGYQLTQAIRSIPSLRDLPVVLMSARAEQIGARFMAQTGAVGAIAKPFTPDALRHLVASALPTTPRTSEPSAPNVSDSDPATTTLRAPPPDSDFVTPAPSDPPDPSGTSEFGDAEPLARTAQERFANPHPRALPPVAQYFESGPPTMGGQHDLFFAERLATLGSTQRPGADIGSTPPLATDETLLGPRRPSAQEASAGLREALSVALTPMIQSLSSAHGPIDHDALARALELHLSETALLGMSAALTAMHHAVVADAALDGSLSLLPLGEVFHVLNTRSQSGLLVVSRCEAPSDAEATFAMHQGRINQGFGRAMGAEFLLGRYLVADELISSNDLVSAVARARAEGTLLGQSLLAHGQLNASALTKLLMLQTSELLYEALRWRMGRFRFEAGGVPPNARPAMLGAPSEPLVLEGLRRLDEWRLIAEYIPNELVVFAHQRGAVSAIGSERLDRDERRVLDAVDGKRTAREIIDALNLNAFDGCKILYRLARARLVLSAAR